MRILLYGNGGSGNHGCEAIVRGTVELLGTGSNFFCVRSTNVAEDTLYGLNQLAEVSPARTVRKKNFSFICAYAKLKLTGNYTDMDGLDYLPGISAAASKTDVALSVGGDNYCYNGTEIYSWLNRAYHKAGIKTVLWGCSVEPEVAAKKAIAEDLSNYNLIVTRESITYEAVRQVQKNTVQSPDPAFFMKPLKCEVDARLEAGNVIGINASPHILKCESTSGMAYENYKQLIRYILSETNATIALIPHVVWSSNDDRTVLRQLYDDFDRNPRLVLIEDHTAPELKYIISRCCFFVGARTHAIIAAYSSCVPTLVMGYSVKARGIARDLFGTEDGYVLPVQDLREPGELTNGFRKLWEEKETVQKSLENILSNYLSAAQQAVNAINKLE